MHLSDLKSCNYVRAFTKHGFIKGLLLTLIFIGWFKVMFRLFFYIEVCARLLVKVEEGQQCRTIFSSKKTGERVPNSDSNNVFNLFARKFWK